jgi:hypothetical protein
MLRSVLFCVLALGATAAAVAHDDDRGDHRGHERQEWRHDRDDRNGHDNRYWGRQEYRSAPRYYAAPRREYYAPPVREYYAPPVREYYAPRYYRYPAPVTYVEPGYPALGLSYADPSLGLSIVIPLR